MTARPRIPDGAGGRMRAVTTGLTEKLAAAGVLVPLVVGLAAFTVCTGAFLWANHDRPELRLEVEFGATACCSWQVWVGGPGGDLTVLPLQPGTDHVYTVPIFRARVDRLFVTVGDRPGGVAVVRRIWVTRGSRTVDEVTAAELGRAAVLQARARRLPSGLELTSSGAQPALDANVSLSPGESRIRVLLARIVSQRLISFAGFVLFGSLLLTLVALEWRLAWPVAVALALTIAGTRCLPWLSDHLRFRDDVSHAVGFSSYTGNWKGRESFVYDASAALAVVAAGAAGLLARRRSRPAGRRPASREPQPRQGRRAAIILVAVPTLVVLLAAAPNLRRLIGPPPQYVPSWDGNNFLFWQYLIQTTSLEPVKDFYWLYGFQWVFDKAPPWGELAAYGWFSAFWIAVGLGTYASLSRFFAGRGLIVRYTLLSAFWLTAFLSSDAAFQTRYIGPLGAVLLFAGIDGARDPLWSWRRVAFAVVLFGVTIFELAQTGYALPPIVLLAAVDLVALGRSGSGWLRQAGRAAATLAVPLAGAAVVFAATRTAAETISTYRTLLTSSAAYAFPTQIDIWISHPTTLESLIFWAVPLTLALGVAGFVLQRGRVRSTYAVVTALGLLGFMILQKQVLRPHIATQVWLSVTFGLAYWAVTDTLLARSRRWPALVSVAAAAGALVLVAGGYHNGWRALVGSPGRLRDSVHALVRDRSVFAAQARLRFTPSTFARFTDDRSVARALRRVPSVSRGRPVWILGDDSPVTMILGRSWPYYLNDMYDASPLGFQKKIVHDLERDPPARVVWNFSPHAMVFDTVPMPVRVPLLYEWAIDNLVPARQVGSIEILRRRSRDEPVPLAWWRLRIGERLDMGHIPSAARVHGKPCTGPPCASFAVVRLAEDQPRPSQVVLDLTVQGLPFELAFETDRQSTYVVPLDRAWFWAAGGSRAIRDIPSGVRVSVVRRAPDDSVLY